MYQLDMILHIYTLGLILQYRMQCLTIWIIHLIMNVLRQMFGLQIFSFSLQVTCCLVANSTLKVANFLSNIATIHSIRQDWQSPILSFYKKNRPGIFDLQINQYEWQVFLITWLKNSLSNVQLANKSLHVGKLFSFLANKFILDQPTCK